MFTIKDYLDWYAKRKEEMLASGFYKSEPTFLFTKDPDDPDDYYQFTPDNWNGGDILRKFLLNNWFHDIHTTDYTIKYYWVDDQTTIYIFGDRDWFEISWYKSRGRTERIMHNGSYIWIDEYVDLCNHLGITLDGRKENL